MSQKRCEFQRSMDEFWAKIMDKERLQRAFNKVFDKLMDEIRETEEKRIGEKKEKEKMMEHRRFSTRGKDRIFETLDAYAPYPGIVIFESMKGWGRWIIAIDDELPDTAVLANNLWTLEIATQIADIIRPWAAWQNGRMAVTPQVRSRLEYLKGLIDSQRLKSPYELFDEATEHIEALRDGDAEPQTMAVAKITLARIFDQIRAWREVPFVWKEPAVDDVPVTEGKKQDVVIMVNDRPYVEPLGESETEKRINALAEEGKATKDMLALMAEQLSDIQKAMKGVEGNFWKTSSINILPDSKAKKRGRPKKISSL